MELKEPPTTYIGGVRVKVKLSNVADQATAAAGQLSPGQVRYIWATEAAFLAVLFTFNLLSLHQQTSAPQTGYRQPATLRAAVFICGAILGRTGRQTVLHLSAGWKVCHCASCRFSASLPGSEPQDVTRTWRCCQYWNGRCGWPSG